MGYMGNNNSYRGGNPFSRLVNAIRGWPRRVWILPGAILGIGAAILLLQPMLPPIDRWISPAWTVQEFMELWWRDGQDKIAVDYICRGDAAMVALPYLGEDLLFEDTYEVIANRNNLAVVRFQSSLKWHEPQGGTVVVYPSFDLQLKKEKGEWCIDGEVLLQEIINWGTKVAGQLIDDIGDLFCFLTGTCFQ